MSDSRKKVHEFEQKAAAAGISTREFYERYMERYPSTMNMDFREFWQAVEHPLTTSDYHVAKRADELFAEMKRGDDR